jgi:hypothetical protein
MRHGYKYSVAIQAEFILLIDSILSDTEHHTTYQKDKRVDHIMKIINYREIAFNGRRRLYKINKKVRCEK